MIKGIKRLYRSDGVKIGVSLAFFALGILFSLLFSGIVSPIFFVLALLFSGGEVFVGAVKGILRLDPLDEKFLMSIAAVGAMIVGEWSEGAAVMIFYLVGESFEHRAVRRSRASIKALMDICPDEACIIVDGEEQVVDADEVTVGASLVIRPGERVAVDCIVTSGSANIDTSAMTGESMPLSASAGSILSSGFVVKDGLIYAEALRVSGESSAARVLELVEFASENKSKEESFITRFSKVYTPIVVLLALLVSAVPPLVRFSTLSTSVYTALTFLVISCPCALVISVPMAFFGGIGGGASRGILFKGGNVFSKLARVKNVAFDKTGTITSGRFEISEVIEVSAQREKILFVAASAESASNHPIAECIKGAAQNTTSPTSAREIAGKGVEALISGKKCAVGNLSLMESVGVRVPEIYLDLGAVFVAEEGVLLGAILLCDSVKEEALPAVKCIKRLGVKNTVILSGDREEKVKRVCALAGIDSYFAELSPEEKYQKLEELIEKGATVYLGDGINDAPALARADVGIAMGSIGQDSAIEASDAVIMTDDLSKLPEAILIARKTIRIARENIVFAIGVKGLILLLGLFGFANMWLAVFADVGVAVLAVLNSMRTLRFKNK